MSFKMPNDINFLNDLVPFANENVFVLFHFDPWKMPHDFILQKDSLCPLLLISTMMCFSSPVCFL